MHSDTCRQRRVLVPRDPVVATQHYDVTLAVPQRREVWNFDDYWPVNQSINQSKKFLTRGLTNEQKKDQKEKTVCSLHC